MKTLAFIIICAALAILLFFVYACFYLSGKISEQEEKNGIDR